MASPLPTLVCKACGYANESQRVYCHGCGAKLDRDVLIVQQQQQTEAAQKRLREVKKIMSPDRGNSAKTWRILFKTLLLALIAAALIDIALPPDNAPADTATAEAPQIDAILENLLASPVSKRIFFREVDVNAYLKRERFKKIPSWITDWIALRAFAHFEEGAGRLTLQAKISGYPIYATLSGCNVKIDKNTGITATCTGGSLGRLQVPAQLAQYAGAAIPFLFDSMKREREMLGQLESVEIKEEQIILGAHAQPVPAAAVAPGRALAQPLAH